MQEGRLCTGPLFEWQRLVRQFLIEHELKGGFSAGDVRLHFGVIMRCIKFALVSNCHKGME